jgi:hypothetical protein
VSSETVEPLAADPSWGQFASSYPPQHQRYSSLALDPLYALPESLIPLIQKEAPGLLDIAFETDLSKATRGGGFFLQRPFRCLLLEDQPLQAQDQADADTAIKDMLEDGLGMNKVQVSNFLATQDKQRGEALRRQRAYAAWLVLNKQFRAERDVLKQEWDAEITRLGRFPSASPPFQGNPTYEPFLVFLRRWCLKSFLTWDLPLPMPPESLGGASTPDLAAGVTVFVPWYLFRDHLFDLRDLASHLKAMARPDHLKDWLSPPSSQKKNLGYARLASVLALYRYLRLALESRYQGQLAGKTQALDYAFAPFTKQGEDSIKKLRLEMAKRLQ